MNTGISDSSALASSLRQIADAQYTRRQRFNGRLPADVQEVIRMAADHLAADAVPVTYQVRDEAGNWKWGPADQGVYQMVKRHRPHDARALYDHPQPAALNEVSGNSGELGALTALVAKWRSQAATNEVNGLEADSIGLTGAAMRHDARQHVLEQAATELEAAVAATGKQPLQVGEAQGDAGEHIKALEAATHWSSTSRPFKAALLAGIAALAARQPVATMSAEASQVARGMVAHCIEHRLCMGMDEGFSSFDPDVEHHFVRELRGFADGDGPPAQGVDLGQFRDLIGFAVLHAIYLPESDPRRDFIRQANELLALIDSRPTLANVTPPRDLRTQLGEVG